jgi:hypothetical protein
MGMFLRIETGDDWPDLISVPPRFLGEILADGIHPVTSYELVHVKEDPAARERVARIEQYPRWAEPGLALAARLIERSEPGFLDDPLGALPLTLALAAGELPDPEIVELITTQRGLGGFGAVMVSQIRHEVVRMPPPRPDATLRTALLEICRCVFQWHLGPSPVPPPLTTVPIHQAPDGPFVLISEIPAHARAHFVLQNGLGTWAATAPAHLWLQFIGSAEER